MISIAQFGLLILLTLFLLLHFFILVKTIPYNLVWGGRLKTDKEMHRFEIFSILINLIFITVVLQQANFLAIDRPKKIITYSLWIMSGLFLLNTVGNAISKNKLEQNLSTPLTILLTIFPLLLVLSNWLIKVHTPNMIFEQYGMTVISSSSFWRWIWPVCISSAAYAVSPALPIPICFFVKHVWNWSQVSQCKGINNGI